MHDASAGDSGSCASAGCEDPSSGNTKDAGTASDAGRSARDASLFDAGSLTDAGDGSKDLDAADGGSCGPRIVVCISGGDAVEEATCVDGEWSCDDGVDLCYEDPCDAGGDLCCWEIVPPWPFGPDAAVVDAGFDASTP